jgi:Spy/CpxP family protein refolding chaperone
MKKLFAIVALSIGFAVAASAQDSTAHKKNKVKSELNLTKEQQSQIKSMHAEYKQKYAALKADSSLSAEQRKQQYKALHQEQQNKMKTILTPEQQSKLMEMKKQKVSQVKQHIKELNLNQDQQAQWKSINKEYGDKMMALKNDKTLSDQQRKDQFKALNKERMDKVNGILNDDQKAKLAEFKKDRHQHFRKHRPEVTGVSDASANS